MTDMADNPNEINADPGVESIFHENCERLWAAGLPVIPLKPYTPNGGRGGEPTGKEPANNGWEAMAGRMPTRDEQTAWKLFNATGNIGLPMGAQSSLVAVDIDTDDVAVLALIDDLLPPSPWHRIGQKGRVQVYRWGGQSTVRIKYRDAGGKLRSLVEILSTGTQIVLPPSIHPKTVQPYRANRELIDCLPVMVELPAEFEQRLRKGLAGLGYELDGGKSGKKPGNAGPGRRGQIGEGARNDTLFKEASRLRGQGFYLDQITALLQLFNAKHCLPPCDDAEVEKCASQGGGYEPNENYELNDTGNARRFARDHGKGVRFVADRGIWRTWTGTHWQDDPAGLSVMALARETVELMIDDAEAVTSDDFAKALRRHARLSGDRARLRAMTDVAASLPGMAAASTDFDKLPGQLAVANGMINLANGELSPHDPANLNTRCLPTAYEPEATAPRFVAFMERVQPDREVRTFLQRYLGQALHGRRDEQIMTWWHGRGRNGKSVLSDTLLSLLPGYALDCPSSTFLNDDKRSPNAPRPDIIRLQGARLVLGSEVADGRRADGALLKELTGNATKTVRALYKEEVTFQITFNMAILVNPWPKADEADDALWTRFVRVPFEVVIPPEEQVKNFDKLLVAEEAAGVLAWLVRGAVDYTKHGLSIPPVLSAATEAWRRRIGTIERYMRTYTRPAPGSRIPLTELHAKYVNATQKTYDHPVGSVNFRSRLEALGYVVADEEFGETVRDVRVAPITSVWTSVLAEKAAA